MIIIICIGVIIVGSIILSKSEKPKNEIIKHKCLWTTTCKNASTCFNEEKESCFCRKN